MSGFFGTHESTLDRKKAGRVTLPRDFRSQLPVVAKGEDGQNGDEGRKGDEVREVVLLQSPEDFYPTVFGFPRYMLETIKGVQFRFDEIIEDGTNIAADILASSRLVKTESSGRLSMPAEFIAFADYGDKVQFCGQGDFFEVWREGGFTEFRDARRSSATRKILQRVAAAGADQAAIDRIFSGGGA